MVTDLASGVLAIAALSVLSFFVGRLIRSPRVSTWFFGALLASLVFAWTFSGSLGWALLVPSPSVVFWSNLMPMLLCFAAGLASEAGALTKWSRPLALCSFVLLASAYALTPYVRPTLYPVELNPQTQWRDDVCLQTHSATCAAAAASTLLHLNGLSATEKEMVESCLTSAQGTEPLGLYRGLATAVQDSGRSARVARADPREWSRLDQLPNISLVRLPNQQTAGSSRWLLGPRSEGHAIVVLGRNLSGDWMIADPAFGKTTWTDTEFRSRFTGDAIYLSERSAR
jgi:hypothetical protein